MANPLDWLGRAALRMGGMSPQQIRQQARANKKSKPMPKAKASTPKPEAKAADKPKVQRQTRVHGRVKPGLVQRTVKPSPPKPPKPPAPGSIDPKGQTSLLKKDGTARDFRKPAQAANRPPTLDPVQTRSRAQATPPKPPIGGPGRQSPGQGYLNLGAGERTGNKDPWGPGTKPNRASLQSQKPRKAPSIPKQAPKAAAKPSASSKPSASQKANQQWLDQNSKAAREKAQKLATKFDAVRGISTKGTIAALATSNFGNEGESPDVRARRLGYKNAADQKAKIEAQKRSSTPARTPEQAIKDAKKSPGKPPGASTKNSTPQYSRPKPNIKPPSAAQQATDKRDKKKLF